MRSSREALLRGSGSIKQAWLNRVKGLRAGELLGCAPVFETPHGVAGEVMFVIGVHQNASVACEPKAHQRGIMLAKTQRGAASGGGSRGELFMPACEGAPIVLHCGLAPPAQRWRPLRILMAGGAATPAALAAAGISPVGRPLGRGGRGGRQVVTGRCFVCVRVMGFGHSQQAAEATSAAMTAEAPASPVVAAQRFADDQARRMNQPGREPAQQR